MLRAAMPEAAIDKDGQPAPRKHEVGRAALGQSAVQTKPSAGGVNGSPEKNLWLGVLLATPCQVRSSASADPLLSHATNLRVLDLARTTEECRHPRLVVVTRRDH